MPKTNTSRGQLGILLTDAPIVVCVLGTRLLAAVAACFPLFAGFACPSSASGSSASSLLASAPARVAFLPAPRAALFLPLAGAAGAASARLRLPASRVVALSVAFLVESAAATAAVFRGGMLEGGVPRRAVTGQETG